MLRTVNLQPTLWESILPRPFREQPVEFAVVDAILDDPVFFEPFRAHFDETIGRPSTPIETYLRLMFLKFRLNVGYERLCATVADSITLSRFCRVSLGDRVPEPSTIRKITNRCGPEVIEALNVALLAKLHDAELVEVSRVRMDTTVVEADICYPTDSGLLTKAIRRISRLVGRIHDTGAATRSKVVDHTAGAQARAHQIRMLLRRRSGEAKDEVLAITGELAELAAEAAADCAKVIVNARRFLAAHPDIAKRGRLRAMIDDLELLAGLTEQVVGQAKVRVGGDTPDGSTRVEEGVRISV